METKDKMLYRLTFKPYGVLGTLISGNTFLFNAKNKEEVIKEFTSNYAPKECILKIEEVTA